MNDVGGLVALAAQWNGCEVRAVRLDEEAVARCFAHDVGQLCRVLIGERAVNADVKAHLPEFPRHLETAGVTVQDARQPLPLLL